MQNCFWICVPTERLCRVCKHAQTLKLCPGAAGCAPLTLRAHERLSSLSKVISVRGQPRQFEPLEEFCCFLFILPKFGDNGCVRLSIRMVYSTRACGHIAGPYSDPSYDAEYNADLLASHSR